MKKKFLFISIALAALLGISGLAGVFSEKKVGEAKADPIVLDDTTDYADKNNYGYRTKTPPNPERAYSQTDLENASSPVYTDLQFSSSKSLCLKDKGKTGANNAIAVLNCFAPASDIIAGNITFGDIKTKFVEFMIHYDGEPTDLGFSIMDLEQKDVRLTTKIAPVAPRKCYLSSYDNSEWYHFIVDLSKFGFNGSCSDASKVGAIRIDTTAAMSTDCYIDQLRLVDAQIFDPDKATPKPFHDRSSMYESDDLARSTTFYGGKYSFTELTDSSNVYGQSTRSVQILATKDNDAYSTFFFDLWKDGIKLSDFGTDAKLIGYIKASLTNTPLLDHATRLIFTFSTSDHNKAVGNATHALYFETFTEADNGWYYFEYSINDLVSAVDSSTYPLESTTVYGLRASNGNYVVATGDYYIFDALMVVDYKETYDLIDDVTNVDTCSSSAEAVSAFKNRYLALNGYDQNTFYNTEIEENETVYTLGYKLDYMCQYYGIAGLNRILFDNNVLNNPTSLIVIVVVSITVLSMISLIAVKRRKHQ